jgi:hypothetical protein
MKLVQELLICLGTANFMFCQIIIIAHFFLGKKKAFMFPAKQDT